MKCTLVLLCFFLATPMFAQQLIQASSVTTAEMSELPDLKLGSPVPQDARAREAHYIMTSPAQLRPEWKWIFDDVEYTLGVDGEGNVRYISTHSHKPQTSNGVHVGMSLGALPRIANVHLIAYRGWAFVGGLPSGWNVAFTCGETMTECEPSPEDPVKWLFRGS